MQRDAYAALVKKKHKKKIPMRILQVNGEIFNELIFDEVFIGYRNRRLVLTTHMAGTDPRKGPRLPHDILIQDFAKLQRYHQPHFVYKLVPLMCSNVESFSVLQAVCSSPGSPFRIEDRYDTHGLTMRFALVSAHREMVKSELLQCPLLSAAQMANIRLGTFPIPGVEFDAALVRRGRITLANAMDSLSASSSAATGPSNNGNPSSGGGGEPLPLNKTSGKSSASDPFGPSSPPGTGISLNVDCPSASAVPSNVGFVSSAALITRVDYLTDIELNKRLIMNYYFHSGTYWKLGSNSTLFQMVRDTRERHHILGVTNPIIQGRTDLLARARQHRVHIYEKVGEDLYQYAK